MNRFETTRRRLSDATDTVRHRAADTQALVQSKLADTRAVARAKLADSHTAAQTKLTATAEGARARVVETAREAPMLARDTAQQVRTTTSGLKDRVSVRSKRPAADLTSLTEREKRWLCHELVALAVVDGSLHPREISSLYLLFTNLGLEPETRIEVRGLLASVQHAGVEGRSPSDLERCAGDALHEAEDERRDVVVMGAVHHMVELALADLPMVLAERERITVIAKYAFPDTATQLVATTERLVANERAFISGQISTSQFEATAKDLTAKVVAFGAPITAVSMVGSVTGLGAAGITSGLATLGFGGVLGLSSMVTGIGTAVIVGVVAHQGVRYLLGTNERGREKKREHLMQQVLLGHQRAIGDLTDDIAALARRIEDHLGRTTANEEQLAALRSDLAAFQTALAQLQSNKETVEKEAVTA